MTAGGRMEGMSTDAHPKPPEHSAEPTEHVAGPTEHVAAPNERTTEATPHAAEPTASPQDAVEAPRELEAVVRTRVNLRSFLILGAIVGAVLAVILTYAFPEHPEFTRGQVLGFFLVFITALSALVFAGIGLLVDAVVSRRQGTAHIRRAE